MNHLKTLYWCFATKSLFSVVLLSLLVSMSVQGQNRSVTARYTSEAVTIDGVMDEPVWETAGLADDYWQYFPSDTSRATFPTEVRILYDDDYFYIAIRAETPGNNFVVETLRRDFSGTTNDNVNVVFDPYNDRTNAYVFGVTPYGVQRDILASGGGSGYNITWDQRWYAESTRHEDHYIVEIAIPFSSIKFPDQSERWGFQAYRWDLQGNEQSAWSRVPQNQLFSSLAFMGDLVFEKPLGRSRTPMAFIPYVNAISESSLQTEGPVNKVSIGGDAKIAVGSGMNLDLTVNPDFSNVEVDALISNLTRFEVSLPERRQFFIDNSDLFTSYGSRFGDALPFFSRRIGIARDTMGRSVENRIIGGARLSGNLNEDWRLGVLNIQTAADEPNRIPSNNNMMLALQRRVFARSSIGAFIVNRQTFGDYDFLEDADRYNRVLGVDYNLASADNTWTGKFYLHKSLQPDDSRGNLSAQATFTYNTRNFGATTDFTFVDDGFRSDLGFVSRTDMFRFGQLVERIFWPETGIINRHSIELLVVNMWRPTLDFQRTDYFINATWSGELRNNSSFRLQYSNEYIYLLHGFDPTRTPDGIPLPGDTGYNFNQVSANYTSSRTNLFTYGFRSSAGEFFSGKIFSTGGNLSLRLQPRVLIGLDFNYNRIRLPDPHPNADIILLSPRFDITFSRSVFWSTLVQYSNQRNNLGFNSRLQWRFAPMSDLYLVYNDNYIADSISPSFRSINLKLSYWFNP